MKNLLPLILSLVLVSGFIGVQAAEAPPGASGTGSGNAETREEIRDAAGNSDAEGNAATPRPVADNPTTDRNPPKTEEVPPILALEKDPAGNSAELRRPQPKTVEEMLRDFRKARENYLKQQQQLKLMLQTASAEEMEQLKKRLLQQRTELLREQRRLRANIREQLEQLRQELRNHGGVIDASMENARNRRGIDP